jgi:hypothetical protein
VVTATAETPVRLANDPDLLPALPALPALVAGHVAHRRRTPVHHGFRHRIYQWLIDLDDVPRMPWYLRPLARFDARDHLGGTGDAATDDLKENVLRYLTHHRVDLGERARIVMLANARVLGHVFDPLSVFWCFDGDGTLRCVVAEVHNTYGERHAYLLHPDVEGVAEVDKQFYVSPFNDVSGRYELRFELTPSRVRVTVDLVRDGAVVFGALLDLVPAPATAPTVVRTALRMPAMTHKVSALIRWHGIRLWLRRLPIAERPVHHPPAGV